MKCNQVKFGTGNMLIIGMFYFVNSNMQFNKFVIFLPQTHFLALDNLPQFRESKVIGSYGLSLFLWVCINDSLTTVFSVKLGNSCVTATNSSLP